MQKLILFAALMLLSTGIFGQKVHTVDYESQADVKVFVVDYESPADLKVYKVQYESQASWNNSSKKHKLY
jgi:hypothetical protein